MKKRVIFEDNGSVSVVKEPIPDVEDEERLEKFRKEHARMEKLRQITNESMLPMAQTMPILNMFPNQSTKEKKNEIEGNNTVKMVDQRAPTTEVFNYVFPFGRWSVRTTKASFRTSLIFNNRRSKRNVDEEENNGYKKDQSFAQHCSQRLYKVLEKLLALEDDVWLPLPP